MGKKELEKLKMELEEVVTRRLAITDKHCSYGETVS